ncbi:divergent polysaccharide deacetylase family protein [Helicobacter sp. 11S02629-2]|uniref:divergent polysaccharide deacetylase family protein n=1 Tax=Helicobacter sp. 11S02629-2 TaxID=1476195 RepID=UPI000BA55D08|nr:divergent polysaccharide deacetylase family protein [Helicobacter sp. 11S02629-2]PAF44404.1 hypothetical protein BKH40_05775 [Helicobacter sp. 11S02629-2]
MSKGKKLALLASLIVVIIIVVLVVVYYFIASSDTTTKDTLKDTSYSKSIELPTPSLTVPPSTINPSHVKSLATLSPKNQNSQETNTKDLSSTTISPSTPATTNSNVLESKTLDSKTPSTSKALLNVKELDLLHAKYAKTSHYKKPMIVIIIDDVSSRVHARRIKSVGLKLTPSVFPKQPITPNTPQIANDFPYYMVHLPLEAGPHYTDKSEWIKMGESYKDIKKKIDEIRKDFPYAFYVNNHAGHGFTSSRSDMLKLLKALDSDYLQFVDSKTIASNVIKQIGKERGKFFLSRDVFLDNVQDENYIAKQMETFLRIARKRGYAIAIGHPHLKTIGTLKIYKDVLTKYYDLVYIGTLNDYLRLHAHIKYYGQPLKHSK